MINISLLWQNTQSVVSKIVSKMGLAAVSFALIALAFGLFFVFSTPLLWGADETTHVGRVYQISHGHAFAHEVREGYSNYGFGGDIPITLKQVIDYVNYDFNVNAPQKVGGVKWVDVPEDYTHFANSSMQAPLVPYNFSNTAIYSPLSYAPSVLAFAISAVANFSIGTTIYFGRILDLLLYVIVITCLLYAIKELKSRWIIYVIALLPASLYQASIINADAVTNTIAFAFAGLLMKALLLKRKMSKLEYACLLLCVVLLPVTKPTYIFISLLILLVPLRSVPFVRYKRILPVAAIVLGLSLYAVWQIKTSHLSNASKWIIAGVVPWWMQIDSALQLQYVLHNPFAFVGTFFRTVLLADNGYFASLFGRLGFNYVQVPGVSVILSTIAMVLAVLGADRFAINRRRLVALSFAVLMSIAAIFGTLYLTISSVGQPTIEGVQGRYFLPLLPFIMLLLAIVIPARLNTEVKPTQKNKFEITLVVFCVISLFLAAAKFYYVTWG